jgi:hypothetical protein
MWTLKTKTIKQEVESDIVADAHTYAQVRGWWTIKIETPTMNGVPDRLYFRNGVYLWIEWKKPGGPLSAIQEVRIADMRKRGMTVHVFDNLADAKKVLK